MFVFKKYDGQNHVWSQIIETFVSIKSKEPNKNNQNQLR